MTEHAYYLGGELRDVKGRLQHGHFLPWLEQALGMGSRTAERLMQISERLGGKFVSVSNLTLTELYALTAPSTPDSVVQQCVVLGEQGVLTGSVLARLIQDEKKKATTPQEPAAGYALDVLKECLEGREAELAALLSPPEIKSIDRYLRELMRTPTIIKRGAKRQVDLIQ